jgi:hypothetical protein
MGPYYVDPGMKMMLLHFWLRLQPLTFSLCSEKIQKLYQILDFSLYSPRMQSELESEPEPETEQHHIGSCSDPYPLAYIVKQKQKNKYLAVAPAPVRLRQ